MVVFHCDIAFLAMYGMDVNSICCRPPVVVLYVQTPRSIATHSHGGYSKHLGLLGCDLLLGELCLMYGTLLPFLLRPTSQSGYLNVLKASF